MKSFNFNVSLLLICLLLPIVAHGSIASPTSYMRPIPGSGWWAWSRLTLYVPDGSQYVGRELGIQLWSYQGWPTSGRTSFDLVTVQATTTGETPVPFTPYPNPVTFDPENPPVWNWHDPNAAAPIPTVSEWGMIVFFILLAGSAL